MGQDVRRGVLGGIDTNPSPKYYAVMLFYKASEIGIPLKGQEDFWVNTHTETFDKGSEALNYYANTPCPASQLLSSDSLEDLDQQVKQMKKNYHDPSWLEVNLYPYL